MLFETLKRVETVLVFVQQSVIASMKNKLEIIARRLFEANRLSKERRAHRSKSRPIRRNILAEIYMWKFVRALGDVRIHLIIVPLSKLTAVELVVDVRGLSERSGSCSAVA